MRLQTRKYLFDIERTATRLTFFVAGKTRGDNLDANYGDLSSS
jgi:hypothetical protein